MITETSTAAITGEIPVVLGPLAARANLIRLGTRGSQLAVTQTTGVARQIAAATGADVALVIIKTTGDVSTAPLAQLGGTGVFVSALRDALLAGECDLAVHSLKDLPTGQCQGITLGAIPARVDARDALCSRGGRTLAELPAGARVGTGSPRRVAQLLRMRPDLEVTDLRGNVDSRLARIDADLDAVVLATAGLTRIGRDTAISEYFALDQFPAAPGQGALAVEVRTADVAAADPAMVAISAGEPVAASTRTAIAAALGALEDAEARVCATAERAMLAGLEAGCQAPVGAWARLENSQLVLTGTVYSVDGNEHIAATGAIDWRPDVDPETAHAGVLDAAALGATVASDLLAGGAVALAPAGTLGVIPNTSAAWAAVAPAPAAVPAPVPAADQSTVHQEGTTR